MTIPERVFVGPYTYRVTTDPDEWRRVVDDPDKHWGYTQQRESLILIDPDTGPVLRRTILLHEILHACAFAAGAVYSRKRKEEDWVVMAALMLLDAMRRSPGLTDYLTAGHLEDCDLDEDCAPPCPIAPEGLPA